MIEYKQGNEQHSAESEERILDLALAESIASQAKLDTSDLQTRILSDTRRLPQQTTAPVLSRLWSNLFRSNLFRPNPFRSNPFRLDKWRSGFGFSRLAIAMTFMFVLSVSVFFVGSSNYADPSLQATTGASTQGTDYSVSNVTNSAGLSTNIAEPVTLMDWEEVWLLEDELAFASL